MECVKCKKEIEDDSVFCRFCGKKQIKEERKHKKRANGSGTIYKMPGNREKSWAAQKNNVYIGAFKTKAEAQKALDRLTDVDINEKFNLTFAEIYEKWLPEHEREITPEAKGTYEWAYKHCQMLHGKKYRTLRASDFQKVIIDLENKGMSKSSCEKVMQLFGQMAAWAMRCGHEGLFQICQHRGGSEVGRHRPETEDH